MKRIAKSDYLPNLKEIENLVETHKQAYSEEKLRERAARDAADGIPSQTLEEPAPFEQELSHAVSALASKVAASFRSSLEMLDAKIKAEEGKIKLEYEHVVENINLEHEIDTNASENAFGLQNAHNQLETAEKRFDEMYAKYGRGPVRYVPHWLYLIFATAIFVGEIPLNALVFQIFGENQVMTWVMAFIIGLAVPLTAHFVGIKLREHSDGFCIANAFKAFSAFAVVSMALFGLSEMRRTYLGEFREELGLTERLVDSSMQFFWLNIAVFVAAIIVAYLAHDSAPGFEDLEKGKIVSSRKVEKAERKRVANLIKSSKLRAQALSKANTDFREKMLEVVMMKGVYDQVLLEGRAHEQRCVDLLGQQLAIYRNENLRLRSGEEMPKCFSAKLDIPLTLVGLSEKLVNDQSGASSNA